MDDSLCSMLPVFVVVLFLLVNSLRRVSCPDCGELLPVFESPLANTRRRWRAGGICPRCGCEVDRAGQKVTADTPPAPFPVLLSVLAAVALTVGIGCGAFLLFAHPLAPAPAPVVRPQQALAVAAGE